MDAAVQLALMEKLKVVLAEPGTFVAFPTAPLSFTSEGLASIVDGAQTAAELQLEGDWLRSVNLVPTGDPLMSLGGRYLWDAYAGVVHSPVVLAEGSFSAEDRAALAAAEAVIYTVDPATDLRVPSAQLKAYDQHRDVWLGWNQAFRKRQLEVQNSADPDDKVYWEEVERPTYQAKIREAEDMWRASGFRREVDAAYATIQAIEAHGPSQRWLDWGSRLSLNVDTQGDLNSLKSVPTGFSPVNFMQAQSWPSLRLEAPEVGGLLAQAPPELLQRFAVTGASPDMVSVSFEYSSVSILRSWFAPELFQARFWRFGDADRRLSDGAAPPHGELPGYIAAAVFLRNLVIERKAGAAPDAGGAVLSPFAKIAHWHAAAVETPAVVLHASPAAMVRARPAAMAPARASMRVAGARLRVAEAGDEAAPIRPIGDVDVRPVRAPLRAATYRRLDASYGDIDAVEQSLAERRATQWQPGRPLRNCWEPPSATTRETVFTNGEMGVLAFICKAFPRCPDPDPGLGWS
jgi:hypothetical protein